jgi:hypothetical protein
MRSAAMMRMIGSVINAIAFEIEVSVGVWICCISAFVAVSIVMIVVS